MKKSFNAFTLAEVLITLGIIGVVAAMTMPTLMNSTQGAQYKAAYKKALSVLSQAVTLNMALDDWNLADLDAEGGNGAVNKLSKLIESRTNYVRKEVGKANLADYKNDLAGGEGANAHTGIDANNVTYFFNDGIMFTYKNTAEKCTKPEDTTVEAYAKTTAGQKCLGYIDVNGIKGPNKVVKCTGKTYNGGCANATVDNPTDIYPVVFFDQSVLPATEAAKTVLYGK